MIRIDHILDYTFGLKSFYYFEEIIVGNVNTGALTN